MRVRSARRRGAVAVLVAVCMVPALGVVAIALEGGELLDRGRSVQAAADASALAAAADLYKNWSICQPNPTPASARAAALSTASANGYSNDGVNSIVTVNIPPLSGPELGQPGYAEVIVQYNQKRGFSGLFGSGTLPIKARAVARGMRKTSHVCVLLLNLSVSGSLTQNGVGTLSTSGDVIVNSNSITAVLSLTGSTLLGSTVTSVGGMLTSNSSTINAASVTTGAAPTADFLAGVPAPDPTQIDDQGDPGVMTLRSSSLYQPRNGETLQPGLYIGGIAVSGFNSVTLAQGVYYMQGGGFTLNDFCSVSGSGVMIYNGASVGGGAFGAITTSLTCKLVLSPPCRGIYCGLSLFQDRTCVVTVNLAIGPFCNITGAIYAAKARVTMVVNGDGVNVGSQIVADNMNFTGDLSLSLMDCSKGYAPRDIRLTE